MGAELLFTRLWEYVPPHCDVESLISLDYHQCVTRWNLCPSGLWSPPAVRPLGWTPVHFPALNVFVYTSPLEVCALPRACEPLCPGFVCPLLSAFWQLPRLVFPIPGESGLEPRQPSPQVRNDLIRLGIRPYSRTSSPTRMLARTSLLEHVPHDYEEIV